MKLTIEEYDRVDSTNSMVKRAIDDGKPEGFVCRAAVQTGGYGRQGRSWVSPPGGSYQSILLQPTRERTEWPTLTLVIGLAVRRALLDASGASSSCVFVKWPNDVMTSQGKLVGISCEAHADAVCVGIGVNVIRPVEQVDLPGKNTPAYFTDLVDGLASEDCNGLIDKVSDQVIQQVSSYYKRWQGEGLRAFLDEYRKSNGILDENVELLLTDGGILTRGRIVDINDAGQLVIEEADGTIQAFSSGEVHIL